MVEAALPFVGFTVAWVSTRALYPSLGVAIGIALVLAVVRLAQRSSLKFVAQAVVPDGDRRDHRDPDRTGRGRVPARHPLQRRAGGRLAADRGGPAPADRVRRRRGARGPDRVDPATARLVRMCSRLTLVLAVPYVLRFVVQLPLFLSGEVVWLARGEGRPGLAAAAGGPVRHRPAAVARAHARSRGSIRRSAADPGLSPDPRCTVPGKCLFRRERCDKVNVLEALEISVPATGRAAP